MPKVKLNGREPAGVSPTHHWVWNNSRMKNIKQAKGNECSQYKSTAAIFSSSLPICPVYFHLVMPRLVLSPCYTRHEHTRGIKGCVTYYLACYVRLQVQNMPWCHLRKYGWGKLLVPPSSIILRRNTWVISNPMVSRGNSCWPSTIELDIDGQGKLTLTFGSR